MRHFKPNSSFPTPNLIKPSGSNRRHTKFLAVLSLLTVIAAFGIIVPAQTHQSATATSANNFVGFALAENSSFFGWIYGAIFPEPEKKAADKEEGKTPSTSAVKADPSKAGEPPPAG